MSDSTLSPKVTCLYRYSATVNGRRRVVVFRAPVGLTSDDVIALVDNTEEVYNRFYVNASQEDYDADREDDFVEVFGWSEVDA